MKKDKFILYVYDDEGNLTSTQIMKSYQQISDTIGTTYAYARTLHLINEGRIKKKYTQQTLTDLQKKYKICDVPIL